MKTPIIKRGWLGGLNTLPISSPFGPRKQPTAGASTNHKGIDIAVGVGTSIKAPFSGTLICKGVDSGGGLYCVLRSGNLELRFMHLSQCILGASAGATTAVVEGTVIGKTGGKKGDKYAGVSTGPHLHFEYRWSESRNWSYKDALNPARFLADKLVSKSGNIISNGLPTQFDKVTGEEISYEVGDTRPMIMTTYSVAEAVQDEQFNSAYETDDDATEEYIDDQQQEMDANEEYAKGIWQIIKLAVDGSVADLTLYDATVSTQTGAMIGFFNKACQQPLAEFSGDTFGDKYFFLIRRPPFDRTGMLKALSSQRLLDTDLNGLESELNEMKDFSIKMQNSEELSNNQDYLRKLERWRTEYGFGDKYLTRMNIIENIIPDIQKSRGIYTILSNEIVNSDINFNNQNIYSWYQYYPQFECPGDDMEYMVPAVFFPEYAAIWGSKSLQLQSQYRSMRGNGFRDDVQNNVSNEVADKTCLSVLDDLKYIIESNAYAPFVRQGTLTIKGSRRIKRGTFIQVQIEAGVDEIFYVESVSQNYDLNGNQVSRTTTLQLSHGMVKKFVESSNKKNAEVSYFNIIDFTGYAKNRSSVNITNWRDAISKWKVNRNIFKFFLRRQQFILPNYDK